MAECARCGDFTDNPPEGRYNYCDDCLGVFDEIRRSGVVIEPLGSGQGYNVHLAKDYSGYSGGQESSQIDALARGKWLSDELGIKGIFTYGGTGSTWLIDEYLREHPSVRRKALNRIRRIPDKARPGLLTRLRNLL